MELRRKFTLLSAVAAMVCAGALMTGCGKEDSAPSEKAAAVPAAQESEEKQVIKIAYIPITHAVPPCGRGEGKRGSEEELQNRAGALRLLAGAPRRAYDRTG